LINSALYRQPVLLDSKIHRQKRLKSLEDFSITQNMHAVYLTATEFPHAGLDFPIIFVNTAERVDNGRFMISPVALLGLSPNENLHVNGPRWDARYLPAFIRRFPFLTAPVQGLPDAGVFVDAAYPGFSDTEGDPLFDAEGKPTPGLERAITFLTQFDEEQQRTRLFCKRVVELDLLKEMQADATLPSGEKLKVEGFLVIDEPKLVALPDATILELHRNGMLMLMQAHLMSLINVRYLVERKAVRLAAATAAAATAPAAPAAAAPTSPPAA
jgi:hypothetical protein